MPWFCTRLCNFRRLDEGCRVARLSLSVRFSWRRRVCHVQNLVDLIAAGFIFLLFASVYRKRNAVGVRYWLLGWFFVLLHFAVSAGQGLIDPVSPASGVGVFLCLATLLLCGVSFVLSRGESHVTVVRQGMIAALLGVPWLGAAACASTAAPHLVLEAAFALAGTGVIAYLPVRIFRTNRIERICLLLVSFGCMGWLAIAFQAHDTDAVLCVVLTECFGLNAVLLSFGRARISAATLTTSVGAVAWAMVWIVADLLQRFVPALHTGPEVWNLPKYVVAVGMLLSLLEEEIHAAAVTSEQGKLMFAGNPQPMWMYDVESLAFLQVNEAATRLYGYSQEQFRCMTLLDIFSPEQSADLPAELQEVGSQQLSGPWLHQRQDGSVLQVDIASQRMVESGRAVVFALMQDVTERQRLHAQLMRQAHHDVLTGLPNRVFFEQQLEDAIAFAAANSARVALFCIDLDRFKQINDSFGHAAGDLCLKEATRRVTSCFRSKGVLARSGGDEFMLFLPGLDRAEDADSFASRLMREMRAPVTYGSTELEIAASVGFAVFPDDGEAIEQLWRDADAAMYQAKRAGGSQWVRVSPEISAAANQVNDIELSLRRSLKTGELEVVYQPQLTSDGHLHSLEALFRSRDPLLKLVPVDRLIAVAEESGLIVALGNWVLDEVCRQMQAWLAEGMQPLQVAVNVSPLQLTRFDFAREVERVLKQYGLSARSLEFEVTESTMMPDRGGAALHQITTLAQMGIRFSVDDFGTGYSSLGRLHQLPVESLKIDSLFTRRIADENGTFPTIEAIIALAHTFGMKVCAEGVETEQQLRMLRALRCDRVQGFFLSRPMRATEVSEFVQALAGQSLCEV